MTSDSNLSLPLTIGLFLVLALLAGALIFIRFRRNFSNFFQRGFVLSGKITKKLDLYWTLRITFVCVETIYLFWIQSLKNWWILVGVYEVVNLEPTTPEHVWSCLQLCCQWRGWDRQVELLEDPTELERLGQSVVNFTNSLAQSRNTTEKRCHLFTTKFWLTLQVQITTRNYIHLL